MVMNDIDIYVGGRGTGRTAKLMEDVVNQLTSSSDDVVVVVPNAVMGRWWEERLAAEWDGFSGRCRIVPASRLQTQRGRRFVGFADDVDRMEDGIYGLLWNFPTLEWKLVTSQ